MHGIFVFVLKYTAKVGRCGENRKRKAVSRRKSGLNGGEVGVNRLDEAYVKIVEGIMKML